MLAAAAPAILRAGRHVPSEMTMRLIVTASLGLVWAVVAACGGGGAKPASDSIATRPAPTTQAASPAATLTATPTAASSPSAAIPTPTPTPAQPTPTQPPTQAVASTPPPPTPTPALALPPAAQISVGGQANLFVPASVTIAAGGTVTWTWRGGFHDLHGLNFALTVDVQESGSATFTFAAAGTYTFRCEVHPDTMQGTVSVR